MYFSEFKTGWVVGIAEGGGGSGELKGFVLGMV